MQIIFERGIQKTRLILLLIIAFTLLSCTAAADNCSPVEFNTSYTRCQISVDYCPRSSLNSSAPSTDTGYRFKSCQMNRCSTLGAGTNCLSTITLGLQQSNCYWSCCQSKSFDPYECYNNNLKMRVHDDSMNGIVAIILTTSALGLLIAGGCFIVRWIDCFKHRQTPLPQAQIPTWRRSAFIDFKCNICEQYGAVIETNCRHYFHMECYKVGQAKLEEPSNCCVCEAAIKKFKLWCGQCHERYIKVTGDQVKHPDTLSIYYNEAKLLHLDCERDMADSPKTDVRFTNSTDE